MANRFMSIREMLFLLFLGAMIAVIAGVVYSGLEWAWSSYDDHDRGLWEGTVVVFVMSACSAIVTRVHKKVYPSEESS